ncbi:hypothetical protein CAOG_01386 [Capsaspora owczarzaki ATCC 30864]|uniref:hypothetical protein n=1 Tax=Capsaspora owczarzaki (strain ATCC 30864) TaxID=595528 RepID=UPI0001FE3257|nr:hypothetical protein CAOG_01386 [Capsaspora owczarzaki ATCC 30864]|eukprot:XP_004349906.1 hypothetical protein CAOG_01386 [Capsaspora owczarzaki ATCC 30864]
MAMPAASRGSGTGSGKSAMWVTQPNAPVDVHVRIGDATPVTVMEALERAAREYSNHTALHAKRMGQWQSWTWREYYDQAQVVAKGVIGCGLEPFRTVAIYGANSPEWLFINSGTLFAGGIPTGVYGASSPKAVWYQLKHSETAIVFVETTEHLRVLKRIIPRLPDVRIVVQYRGQIEETCEGVPVLSWDQFLGRGKDVRELDVRIRCGNLVPGNCAGYLYTAGTTGNPMAVMLSHDNLVWTARQLAHKVMRASVQDRIVSCLPLCFVASQLTDIYVPLVSGAAVYFAPPEALRAGLREVMREVMPTIVLGVPRMWEKLQQSVKIFHQSQGWFRKKLCSWAANYMLRRHLAVQNLGRASATTGSDAALANNSFSTLPSMGSTPPTTGSGQHSSHPNAIPASAAGEPLKVSKGLFGRLVDSLWVKEFREHAGLAKCRVAACCAAPLSTDALQFMMSLDIIVDEVFGLTESTGPAAHTFGLRSAAGSSGRPLIGTEFKLTNRDKARNGEIRTRGRHVFMGYLRDPEETAEAFDEDGYLKTGDVGKLDTLGNLIVTGRLKELIATSGGVLVAPIPIEESIKKAIPVISNALVIGDGRKYVTALLTLKTDCDANGLPYETLTRETQEILAEQGIRCRTSSEAVNDRKVQEFINVCMRRTIERSVSRAQAVKKWTILAQDFSVAGGELGPTHKLKRRVIESKYVHEIERMYANDLEVEIRR